MIRRLKRVSILTRLEGRVQREREKQLQRNDWFQSSPDSKVGCNRWGWVDRCACYVSILTRLEGRVQRENPQRAVKVLIVSILTRLEGRVQPWSAIMGYGLFFVSILTRLEGRVQRHEPH